MDQGTLVAEQIDDGKRLLDRLAEEGVPITAAAWVKESQNGRWYLYLATPLVNDEGATKEAYRRIYPVVRQMPDPFGIHPSRIRAVGPTAPVTEAMTTLQRRFPGRGAIRFEDYLLGDVCVEGAYIYPASAAPVR